LDNDGSEGGATVTVQKADSWPQLRATPLITGAVLIGVGGMAAGRASLTRRPGLLTT